MSTRIVDGRAIGESDSFSSPLVVLVNEAFVARYVRSQPAVGKRLIMDSRTAEIVGVMRDIPDLTLRQPPAPAMTFPLAQAPHHPFRWSAIRFVVRARDGDPALLAQPIRRQLQARDPAVVIDQVSTMEERVVESIRLERDSSWLLNLFATLAVFLAAVGIYAVTAFAVTQRTKELGIRIALGARGRDVKQLVVGGMLVPTAAGLVLGIAGAAALTRFLGTLLHGVTPLDPPTFAAAAAVILLVVFTASYLPARRASRVDPMSALRCE
jgi:putative ABC transport system permease protein